MTMTGTGQNAETEETVCIEVDAELIQTMDDLAQQHRLSMNAVLQKCLIAGINHNALNH
jgi:hypothetical protein